MALSWLSITLLAILLTSVYIRNRLRVNTSSIRRDEEAEQPGHLSLSNGLSKSAQQQKTKLTAALPHIVISPDNTKAFHRATKAYWDQKACEAAPACVVQPRNVWELASAVKIVKREFDLRSQAPNGTADGVFAVRSGGHSPVAGASSIKGGALIDLSLFNEVTLSTDGTSVVLGTGCKWVDVYKTLEAKGLAVAGGRNSAVGVGGLTLGGGLSFFSPRFGFVCSNIVEYEIVLADGTVTKASEAENRDLWQALKGGSNNFGIVTRFTARTFPSTNIWSGFLYIPHFEAPRVLSAFHNFVNRTITNDKGHAYDENAAGPLTCFTYLQKLGIQAIAINVVHTKPPEGEKQWPECWRNSAFTKLWRFWNTCTVRSLTSATDEMSALNAPGRRQEFATTTIKNDIATLEAAHKAYRDAIATIRKHKIKNMSWTLVLQPLLPNWAGKGDPNPMGLAAGTDEPLVNVSFTVNWALGKDDEMVSQITRDTIEQIDTYAKENGTAHRYRYLNYCASWQKPFEGYGEDHLEFLREVSRKVDPDGLFQQGCAGGFKLWA
jgi:FAD/FMN-containing dehydrogenase